METSFDRFIATFPNPHDPSRDERRAVLLAHPANKLESVIAAAATFPHKDASGENGQLRVIAVPRYVAQIVDYDRHVLASRHDPGRDVANDAIDTFYLNGNFDGVDDDEVLAAFTYWWSTGTAVYDGFDLGILIDVTASAAAHHQLGLHAALQLLPADTNYHDDATIRDRIRIAAA
jgi:hypothetical protein